MVERESDREHINISVMQAYLTQFRAISMLIEVKCVRDWGICFVFLKGFMLAL